MSKRHGAPDDPREHGKLATTRILLLAILLTSVVSVFYVTSDAAGPGYAWRSVPLDDVWIHQVYARSIAEGDPFAYNPGEQETGATSPLWAIALAPGHWFGAPVAFSKLLCVLFTALASWTGWRLARVMGESRAGVVFAIAFPLVPYFAFAGVSGAEVPLFVFLMISAIERALTRHWRWAGVTTGLAILARPEGFLLLGAITLAMVLESTRTSIPSAFRSAFGSAPPSEADATSAPNPRLLRTAAAFLLPSIVVVAPWVFYCLITSGKPLPATFYAKAHWYGPFNLDQFLRIGALLTSQPFFGSLFGAVATAFGAVVGLGLTLLGTIRSARAGKTAFVLVGMFGWMFLYGVSLTTPLGESLPPDVPGSVRNFYFARYLLPGFVPLLLVICLGGVDLNRRVSAGSSLRRTMGRGLVLVILLFVGITAARGHVQAREVYSWNCQNIEELTAKAARWIAEHVPPEASVGVSDAGAMRYFGEHRIVDLAGLNSHRLQPFLRELARAPSASPEEAAIREQFWREEGPDCLAITVRWNLPLVRNLTFTHLTSFQIERNTICGGAEIVVVVRPDLVDPNQP